jgi:hypothetical protein
VFHKHLKRNLAIICFIGLFIIYFSFSFGGWGLDQQNLYDQIDFHYTSQGLYDSSFIYGVNRPWPKIPTLKLIQDVLLFFIPVLLFFIIALKKFVINSWPVAVVSSVMLVPLLLVWKASFNLLVSGGLNNFNGFYGNNFDIGYLGSLPILIFLSLFILVKLLYKYHITYKAIILLVLVSLILIGIAGLDNKKEKNFLINDQKIKNSEPPPL